MFDKKNAAKVKTVVMHFLLKGKKLLEKWVYSVGLIKVKFINK
jgi:hypothetical protein